MTTKFSDDIGKLRSPTSLSLDMEAEDTIYKQIQQAFITTATQLVGMAVALLLYWNYVMLKPYLTPFFWSLTFCIVLYKPRQAVINFLKPLSKFEVDPNNDSYKLRALAKAKFFLERIAHPLKNFNMVFFVFLVLGYIFCAYVGFYFSIPIFWMLGLPLFVFATSILALTLCNSKYHGTLVAAWFLLFLCVGSILLFHFFVTKSTQEGWTFIENVRDVLQDPNLQTTLTEYGFTSQFVKDRVQDGQYYLDNWLQSNNVNITSIYNLFSKQNSTTSIVNSMQKDHWQFLQSLLKIDTTPVRRVGTFFLQTGFDFLWVMGSFFGSFYNFVTYLLVFLACLYYLLQSDTFFIEYIAAILPIHNQSKSNFVDTLTKSINGIFVGSFLVCISHGLITYFFFYLLDLNYIYVATFITAFTALFPFVSSSLIFVPVLFVLRLKENPLWWYYVVAYAVSQFFLLWILEPFIYRRIPASHPYLTGIAIVLGWSAFGFEGVFLGPMLIVFTITAYDLFQSNKNIALNTSRHRRKKRKVSSGRYYGLSPSASMDHHVETKL